MSGVASDLLVGVIVAVSALYTLWRLGPRRLRDTIAQQLSRLLPWMFKAGNAPASGCEVCGGCAFGKKKRA